MGDQPLGRLIRRRRDTLGFSQARLGELVGRSASTIRNWERGKSTPASRGDAVALAAVLGLEEHEVLESAGFDVGDDRSHQTVEQAYASLAPPEETPSERPVEEEEESAVAVDSPAEKQAPTEDIPEDAGTPEPPERRSRRLAAVPVPTEMSARAVKDERREVARAAPPTVLETAPPDEPSYLEDPDERQRYRARAVATAALVIFLVIVFIWSFDRAVDALGTMWNDFVGMLEI
ncbi:MAG TPA: helix-turn-helix transcriptional regulator [Acidimicrobiia bacterium]|nr:helix-turn-helix transcriptional regulator [Acidimicrobiia bacterium]